MKYKAILFDMDGTLLPMDADTFTKGYFKTLYLRVAKYGIDAKDFAAAMWEGVAAMVKNDGSMTNEERFWKVFPEIMGERALADMPLFEDFYANEFNNAKSVCGFNPKAAETVTLCKSLGLRTVLATSPLFPAVATRARAGWAGLSFEDFELVTTYENSTTCKPNPAYYLEVCRKCGMEPTECLMVGNDAIEDMIAETVGMKVFLLTDCLQNKKNVDISRYPQGDFDALKDYIKSLAAEN